MIPTVEPCVAVVLAEIVPVRGVAEITLVVTVYVLIANSTLMVVSSFTLGILYVPTPAPSIVTAPRTLTLFTSTSLI